MAAPHQLLVPLLTGTPLPNGTVIGHDVVDSAAEHWVTPLLEEPLARPDLEVDDGVRARVTASVIRTEFEYAARRDAATALAEAAGSVGVEVAVFKGLAIATKFYPVPGRRSSVDIDVFINPRQLHLMGALIEALGGDSDDRRAVDSMVAEGRMFEVSASVGGTLIDIHRDPMHLATLTKGEIQRWERTEPFVLDRAGVLRTLDTVDSLLQASVHAMRDNFADLLHLHDIHMMMETEPDWDEVERRAADEGWTDAIRFAVWFVSRTFGRPSPLPTDVARWRRLYLDLVWPSHLLLQGQQSHIRSFRRHYLIAVLMRGRPGAVIRAYRKLVLPPRSVIEHRHGPSRAPYPIALARWRLSQKEFFSREWRDRLELTP